MWVQQSGLDRGWIGGKGARRTEEGDVFKVKEGRSGGFIVVQAAGESGRSCAGEVFGGDVGLGVISVAVEAAPLVRDGL